MNRAFYYSRTHPILRVWVSYTELRHVRPLSRTHTVLCVVFLQSRVITARKGAGWYRDYLNPQEGNSLSPDLAAKFFKGKSPDSIHASTPHSSWQSDATQTTLRYLTYTLYSCFLRLLLLNHLFPNFLQRYPKNSGCQIKEGRKIKDILHNTKPVKKRLRNKPVTNKQTTRLASEVTPRLVSSPAHFIVCSCI